MSDLNNNGFKETKKSKNSRSTKESPEKNEPRAQYDFSAMSTKERHLAEAKVSITKNKSNQLTQKYKKYSWVIKIVISTFFLTILFSAVSDRALSVVNTFFASAILLFFIFLGIVFDIIGIASATAQEGPFHSMNAKRVKGAGEAIWVLQNADKVSNFCNDVIGDICGIISGTTTAIICTRLVFIEGMNPLWVSLPITALTASLTVGGKAIGKTFAMKNNRQIVLFVGKVIHFFLGIFRKGDNK